MKLLNKLLINERFKQFKGFVYLILGALFTALLFELVTGNSPFGRLTGWGAIIIIVCVNLWGIWVSRNMLKSFKHYVFTMAESKALEHREKKKDE